MNKYDYNYLIIFFLNCCNIVINLVKFDAWYIGTNLILDHENTLQSEQCELGWGLY